MQLLVDCEDAVLGEAGIDLGERIQSHVGSFFISLAKNIRGQGIGKMLMKLALDDAESSLPQLRIITLAVFGVNLAAQGLYKKFGFQEYGRLPEGVFYNGRYVDDIFMYKKVK